LSKATNSFLPASEAAQSFSGAFSQLGDLI
jgi:hypothetical protein